MINCGKTYHGEGCTIDLTPYMEPSEIRPLLDGHILRIGKKTFRTERHHVNDFKGHCYVFIDITLESSSRDKPFAKKPSYVQEAIENKKITITNTIYPIWK